MPLKSISPKELILTSQDLKTIHQRIVDNPGFETSVCFALAEMARMNPTQDQIRGANIFIEIFTSLAEPIPEGSVPYPHKHLSHVGKTTEPEKK